MKKFVIVLVIVVGLLLAADYGAATAAEYQVAQQMRVKFGLNEDPAVKINGFPFLTQAIAGEYSSIRVQATGVPAPKVKRVDVDVTLHKLHAPLSDLTNGSTQHVSAEEVDGGVQLKALYLGELIGIPDLTIDRASDQDMKGDSDNPPIAIAQDDKTKAPVRMTGTTTIAGMTVKGVVIGVLSLVDGKLQIAPSSVKLDNGSGTVSLPKQLRVLAMRAFTTTLDPGELPFSARPTEVSLGDGALGIRGTAHNVPLNSLSGGTGQ